MRPEIESVIKTEIGYKVEKPKQCSKCLWFSAKATGIYETKSEYNCDLFVSTLGSFEVAPEGVCRFFDRK